MEQPQPTKTPVPVTPFTVARVVIGTIIGILFIAGAVAFSAQYVYVIFVFPLLMAFAAGMFAGAGGYRLNIRDRWMLVVLAALIGLIIYGIYRYSDFLLFVHNHQEINHINELTFDQYVQLVALTGMTMGTGPVTWAYWGLEVIMVTVVSGILALRINRSMDNVVAKNARKNAGK